MHKGRISDKSSCLELMTMSFNKLPTAREILMHKHQNK
jgi:hypothetical protein